ncbi:MAG: zinc ABC transporter substrate-binding protein [Prevotellaceae bacterium]|jgi:ABC-type Zn uptake system ZnuABC Zn-binding protein ZnuA|nr:zinc ABC transporter substrate-binding protein [Prevotellaceae bacterium]
MDAFVDTLIRLLTDWGYPGLFVSALLAGSIVPFSSELVMVALVQLGLSPVGCIIAATLGNTVGGMTCYYIGRMGKMEWIERYLRVRHDKSERTQRFLQGKGSLMGFFAFLPFVGEAIAIALGLMRSNVWLTTLSMFVGKLLRYAVMLLAMEGVISSATGKSAGTPAAADSDQSLPLITVSIEPLRYFTEALAGNRFSVTSMVPKGSVPESYDPTPRQLIALSRSRAYLTAGHLPFEQAWMQRFRDNAPGLLLFDTSAGIPLLDNAPHSHADGDTRHRHAVDPHTWSSTVNARYIVDNIARALAALDTLHRTEYFHRRDSLQQQIAALDTLIRQRLGQPDTPRAFMIYHPALTYFARDYGLKQIPIEADGKEPSPTRMKWMIETCRKEGVRVILVQPEFDRKNAAAIARETGAGIVPVNPLAYDWAAEMLHTADALSSDKQTDSHEQ